MGGMKAWDYSWFNMEYPSFYGRYWDEDLKTAKCQRAEYGIDENGQIVYGLYVASVDKDGRIWEIIYPEEEAKKRLSEELYSKIFNSLD